MTKFLENCLISVTPKLAAILVHLVLVFVRVNWPLSALLRQNSAATMLGTIRTGARILMNILDDSVGYFDAQNTPHTSLRPIFADMGTALLRMPRISYVDLRELIHAMVPFMRLRLPALL